MSNRDPHMEAYWKHANEERKAQHEAAIAAMTPERAIKLIVTGASILGDNDYLRAENHLYIVAEWLGRKMEVPELESLLKRIRAEIAQEKKEAEESDE